MVYDKKRSGDPDFDDKVPADAHAGGKTVTAGDGSEVFVSDSLGPITPEGSHADLEDPKGDATDNRPAPGQVATEVSEVQTYQPEDTPVADAKAAPKPAAKSTK